MKYVKWANECRYIEDVMDKNAQVSEMNFDKEVFLRYCEMQRDTANRETQYDAITFIQHVIDDLKGE